MSEVEKTAELLTQQTEGFSTEVYGDWLFPVPNDKDTEFSSDLEKHFQIDAIVEFAKCVGKVRIFKKLPDQRMVPLCQGSVIKLSDTIMVTADHVVKGYNPEDQVIFVNFGNKPIIPQYVSLDNPECGWIQVEIHKLNKGELGKRCIPLCQDFVFLKKSNIIPTTGCLEQVNSTLAKYCSEDLNNDGSKFVALGFFNSSDMEFIEDFFREAGFQQEETKQCKKMFYKYHSKALDNKLILCERGARSSEGSKELLCDDHVIAHTCLTISGVSGGMVASVDGERSLNFCAMHVGAKPNRKKTSLKATVFMSLYKEINEYILKMRDRVIPMADDGSISPKFHGKLPCQPGDLADLTRRVAKLCVFRKESKGTINDLLIESSATQLSTQLLVTARHVFDDYNPDDLLIFVHFGRSPAIPKNASMETDGWIPVDLYATECSMVEKNTQPPKEDYVFLKPKVSSLETLPLPATTQESGNSSCLLVGYLSRKDVGLERDDNVSRDLTRPITNSTKIVSCGKVIPGGVHDNQHVSYDCLSGSGMAGGMVVLVHDGIPRMGAMHLGIYHKNNGLKATHILEDLPL